MDTRKYIEYRDRINGSTSNEHLDFLQKEIATIKDTSAQDNEELAAQITAKRAILLRLSTPHTGTKTLTSHRM